MVKVTYLPAFEGALNRLDKSIFIQAKKLIEKIIANPEIGKPMKYNRKGTREVYLTPFRLSYRYDKNAQHIDFLNIYHKKHQ